MKQRNKIDDLLKNYRSSKSQIIKHKNNIQRVKRIYLLPRFLILHFSQNLMKAQAKSPRE